MNERPKPWERQPGESEEAYYAFTLYRDMPPRERSMRKVADLFYGRKPASGRRRSIPGTIRRWADRFAWVERVLAWDEEQDRIKREAAREAVEEMLRRHAQEAVALQTKALQRLKNMDPAELSPRDVLAFFVEAAKLERISRGEPETISEERNPWIEAVLRAWERRLASRES